MHTVMDMYKLDKILMISYSWDTYRIQRALFSWRKLEKNVLHQPNVIKKINSIQSISVHMSCLNLYLHVEKCLFHCKKFGSDIHQPKHLSISEFKWRHLSVCLSVCTYVKLHTMCIQLMQIMVISCFMLLITLMLYLESRISHAETDNVFSSCGGFEM